MIGRYYTREPATVEQGSAWPLVKEQPYVAECPAGGHDAAWTGQLFGKTGEQYECRTRVVVDCAVCP